MSQVTMSSTPDSFESKQNLTSNATNDVRLNEDAMGKAFGLVSPVIEDGILGIPETSIGITSPKEIVTLGTTPVIVSSDSTSVSVASSPTANDDSSAVLASSVPEKSFVTEPKPPPPPLDMAATGIKVKGIIWSAATQSAVFMYDPMKGTERLFREGDNIASMVFRVIGKRTLLFTAIDGRNGLLDLPAPKISADGMRDIVPQENSGLSQNSVNSNPSQAKSGPLTGKSSNKPGFQALSAQSIYDALNSGKLKPVTSGNGIGLAVSEPLEGAPFLTGDVILSVDGSGIRNPSNLSEFINSLSQSSARELTIQRGTIRTSVSLPAQHPPNNWGTQNASSPQR